MYTASVWIGYGTLDGELVVIESYVPPAARPARRGTL
jgi:hypothetical protein